MEIKDWLTLIASIGALFFSLLNYRRSARFENSNHLYQLKIEVYSKFLSELSRLLDVLGDRLALASTYLKNPTEFTAEELEKNADEFDNAIFEFDHLVISNSLVVPKKVLLHLEAFNTYLMETDISEEKMETNDSLVSNINETMNTIIRKANILNVLMRKDLHIDQLNASLYRRLK